jgi:leucyl/phenylalanyl-tRNA--protein transferase
VKAAKDWGSVPEASEESVPERRPESAPEPASGSAAHPPRDVANGLAGLSASERSRIVREVLALYREGWFPMARTPRELARARRREPDAPEVQWVQPQERALIPLDERFHVPRRLAERVRSGRFVVTSDVAFSRVIRACGEPRPGREETWLHPEIVGIFGLLHEAGHAHSVEAWLKQASGELVLVGGMYGLAMGRVFAGESMFSRPELGGTDASKVCLVHLVRHLRSRGFAALDAQLENPHLAQFGLELARREEYLELLARESGVEVAWGWRGVATI